MIGLIVPGDRSGSLRRTHSISCFRVKGTFPSAVNVWAQSRTSFQVGVVLVISVSCFGFGAKPKILVTGRFQRVIKLTRYRLLLSRVVRLQAHTENCAPPFNSYFME